MAQTFSFDPARTFSIEQAGPRDLITVDVNQDGHLDIITLNLFSSDFSIMLGDGVGNFSFSDRLEVGDVPTDIIAIDLDQDAFIDLAMSHEASRDVTLLRGIGNGQFETFTTLNYAIGETPNNLISGDFNLDGTDDLGVVLPNAINVQLRDPNGTFETPSINYLLTARVVSPRAVAAVVADLNQDDTLDIVSVNDGLKSFTVLRGVANGQFSFQAEQAMEDIIEVLMDIAIRDINRDGYADILALRRSETISVHLGDGGVTYGQSNILDIDADNIMGSPQKMILADLNGDQFLEGIVTLGQTDEVIIFNPNTLQTLTSIPVGDSPIGLIAADVNEDGKPDLAVVNEDDHSVSILLNATGDNQSPEIISAIPDLTLSEGFAPIQIDFDTVFSDSEGGTLNYSGTFSPSGIINIAREGAVITITGQGTPGEVMITANAMDDWGAIIRDTFMITVTERINMAPIVKKLIPDQMVSEGFGQVQFDLDTIFDDDHTDDLFYTASADPSGVVRFAQDENILTIFEGAVGTTSITITADDREGEITETDFTLTVDQVLRTDLKSETGPVYPNPARDFIYVTGADRPVLLTLTGHRLQRRMQRTDTGWQIHLSDLPPGIYLLMIGDAAAHRIIKSPD